MIHLDNAKLDAVIEFIVHQPTLEQFKKIELDLYSRLEDGKNGLEFKQFLANKFKDSNWHTKLNHQSQIELGKRLDFGPLYHAIARRFPKDQRKDLFPGISLYESVAPSGRKLNELVKFIVNPELKDGEALESWQKMLHYLNLRPEDVVQAIADALNKRNKLGLNDKELMVLADRMDDPLVKKSVFQNLSPSDQKARADLSEDELNDKKLSVLDKAVIQYIIKVGQKNEEAVSAELQKIASEGNQEYLGTLQAKLDAKDLMILAKKIIALADSELKEIAPGPSNSFTSTVNTAPFMVPLGSASPAKKKKKR